jgi:hypothetical protein
MWGPAAQVVPELDLLRYANTPSYALPDFDA